ncbi:MAG: VWA domain-containing protein [Acidobacteriota bacterium]|nr:MAG: VWA domain-containing protein [Acidobacteriota bacterium]
MLRTFKSTILILILGLAGWRAAGHPEYLGAYLNDPRSKQEFRTDCTICHKKDGRMTEAGFFTEFGRDFRAARYRIDEEMRRKYPRLFIPADQPIEGLAPETVSISTSQVIVNVTVTNARGGYVTGLDSEAFQLLEDDREQEVSEFLGFETPMAVAVVLDVSGSVIEKDLDRYRNAVLDLAYRLRPSDTLAIYTFDRQGVRKIRDFTSTVEGLKPLLRDLGGDGKTPLYDAILTASAELRERPERRRAMILISDGADSASSVTLREVETQTFLAGTSVYAIDLVNTEKSSRRSAERQAAAQTLKQIAQESGGRYLTTEGGFFLIPSRTKLKRIFKDLIDELHSQYTIVYEPANLRRQGRWRTIRVNLEQADLMARARLGYREGIE